MGINQGLGAGMKGGGLAVGYPSKEGYGNGKVGWGFGRKVVVTQRGVVMEFESCC